jgi:succinyl-diaminopimelate desuccinylase
MKEEIIKTLKYLLSFKTYKENEEEFVKLFSYIKNNYKELYIKEYLFNNKTAIVLSNKRCKKFDVLFVTHIDVVYADDYKYIEDDKNIYGRGTIDMKGSVAVALNILKNIKTNKKIGLIITSDEEIDGNCSKELSEIYKSKIVIIPDGGSNFDLIKEEKGLLQLKLSFNGKSAHASQPYKGNNAIKEMINIYNKLLTLYPLPLSSNDYVTSINLSKINGGTSINQVPDYCEMYLDIRHVVSDTKKSIIDNIKKINPAIDIEILLEGDIFDTDLNNKYVKKYIESCEKILNKSINITGCESTSDGVYFYKNNPTIIMNPIGDFAHSDNEYVNKDSLYTLYKIYENYIGGDDCGSHNE